MRHHQESDFYIGDTQGQDPVWSDTDTIPSDQDPWNLDKDTIGMQESLAFYWNENDCYCEVDGNHVDGKFEQHKGGDDGFTYFSLSSSCTCDFQCHAD